MKLRNSVDEEFCQNIALGRSQKASYLITHPTYKGKNAKYLGHCLRQKDDVRARIDELLEKSARKHNFTKETILQRLADILDISPDDAELDDPNCDLKYVTKEGTPVAVPPDRLRALELAAKISGVMTDKIELTASSQVLELVDRFKE